MVKKTIMSAVYQSCSYSVAFVEFEVRGENRDKMLEAITKKTKGISVVLGVKPEDINVTTVDVSKGLMKAQFEVQGNFVDLAFRQLFNKA